MPASDVLLEDFVWMTIAVTRGECTLFFHHLKTGKNSAQWAFHENVV